MIVWTKYWRVPSVQGTERSFTASFVLVFLRFIATNRLSLEICPIKGTYHVMGASVNQCTVFFILLSICNFANLVVLLFCYLS